MRHNASCPLYWHRHNREAMNRTSDSVFHSQFWSHAGSHADAVSELHPVGCGTRLLDFRKNATSRSWSALCEPQLPPTCAASCAPPKRSYSASPRRAMQNICRANASQPVRVPPGFVCREGPRGCSHDWRLGSHRSQGQTPTETPPAPSLSRAPGRSSCSWLACEKQLPFVSCKQYSPTKYVLPLLVARWVMGGGLARRSKSRADRGMSWHLLAKKSWTLAHAMTAKAAAAATQPRREPHQPTIRLRAFTVVHTMRGERVNRHSSGERRAAW